MKLTTKQIKEIKFTIQKNGYLPSEVDEFLDRIISDYEEDDRWMLDNDKHLPWSLTAIEKEDECFCNIKPMPLSAKIKIDSTYNGELLPNTVEYDGTISDWIHIDNKGIFENVPCINCIDGQYIQKL